jgi:hypothetical protein
MRQLYRILLGVALVCAFLAGAAQQSIAQNVTSGTLTGVVMDAQKGVLPGATVTAVHTPTGTTYEAVTQADGRFTMNSVRVGGPYTIKTAMSGFKTEEQSGVNVGLGESRTVEFTLSIASVSETVNVVAAAQIIDTTRAGTAANVASQAIETLPTINRSIADFARTSPFFNSTQDSANAGYDQVIVAGRNNRYNNMQIDGAVNNDVFGLASSGTPGGQTSTQPISIDAVQEIQLVVSPYDVRQGGFTGGAINAVTKSGTNAFHGTGYWFQRNQNLIGVIPSVVSPNSTAAPTDVKVGTFKDRAPGFTLGGPIVTNKAFFFGSAEFPRRATPVGWSADGSSGQQFSNSASVQQVADIAKNLYGYSPGGLSEMSKTNNSDRVFIRGDFNLSSRNQLTVRTNYINAIADVGGSSASSYNLPSNYYHMTDKMISSVGQLNSNFGNAFNELRIVYSRERNVRGNQPGYPNFPQVQVTLPDTTSVYLGTEYASQGNKLNQDIIEATDDLTIVKGQHTFSLGSHNEFYKFYNLYLPNGYGSYRFSSIANFQAGIAQLYSYQFSNDPSNPQWAAQFSVRQFGFYAGDKWRAKSDLTLTYGVRLDLPRFPSVPSANPLAINEFGYATNSMPSPTMWSPRAGFNWDLSHGGGKRQLRGGVGLFTGRTPYVWLSNQYGNSGMNLTTLSVAYSTSNKLVFSADPTNQPKTVTGGVTGRQTINVVDPNYKYPAQLRGNIGFDHDLGLLGLIGTAEFVLGKTVKDVNYTNLNYINVGGTQIAPTYGDYRLKITQRAVDPNIGDVMLLYNTTQGYSWNVAYKLERPFKNGFSASGSILYGHSYSVNDGTSSVARSNWTGDPAALDVNNPVLTTSNYDPGMRINLAATIPIPMPRKLRSTVSFFFNGMNGRPYAQGFYNDVNGDSVTNNDLLFVPVSADQVIIKNGTWDQLNAYLSSDPAAKDHRGEINPRNSARAPWQNQLDFRYALNIPFGGSRRVEVTADVFNFLNLLNKNWGWQYWAAFPGIANPITYGGIDATTKKEIFDLSFLNGTSYLGTFQRDSLRSAWQAQLGLRFRF